MDSEQLILDLKPQVCLAPNHDASEPLHNSTHLAHPSSSPAPNCPHAGPAVASVCGCPALSSRRLAGVCVVLRR
eukprot:1115141-Rhodomonas_salina.1